MPFMKKRQVNTLILEHCLLIANFLDDVHST